MCLGTLTPKYKLKEEAYILWPINGSDIEFRLRNGGPGGRATPSVLSCSMKQYLCIFGGSLG